MNINENMFCDFRQPSIVIKNTPTVLKKRKRWGKALQKAFHVQLTPFCVCCVKWPWAECERCSPELQLLGGLAGDAAHCSSETPVTSGDNSSHFPSPWIASELGISWVTPQLHHTHSFSCLGQLTDLAGPCPQIRGLPCCEPGLQINHLKDHQMPSLVSFKEHRPAEEANQRVSCQHFCCCCCWWCFLPPLGVGEVSAAPRHLLPTLWVLLWRISTPRKEGFPRIQPALGSSLSLPAGTWGSVQCCVWKDQFGAAWLLVLALTAVSSWGSRRNTGTAQQSTGSGAEQSWR